MRCQNLHFALFFFFFYVQYVKEGDSEVHLKHKQKYTVFIAHMLLI